MNLFNQNAAQKLLQQMGNGKANVPPIDQQKLLGAVGNFDKNKWSTLVAAARAQGISEEDIQSGLQMLLGK